MAGTVLILLCLSKLVILTHNLMRAKVFYPHTGEKETEAQNGQVNYPRSHSWEAGDLGFKPTLQSHSHNDFYTASSSHSIYVGFSMSASCFFKADDLIRGHSLILTCPLNTAKLPPLHPHFNIFPTSTLNSAPVVFVWLACVSPNLGRTCWSFSVSLWIGC